MPTKQYFKDLQYVQVIVNYFLDKWIINMTENFYYYLLNNSAF